MHYVGGYAVRWNVYGIDLSHHQEREGIPSVERRVFSIDLSHHQYGVGSAVRIREIISMDKGVW